MISFRHFDASKSGFFRYCQTQSLVDILKVSADFHYSSRTFEAGVLKYQNDCSLITKESVLYRDIFKRHFIDNVKWMADYWTPNRGGMSLTLVHVFSELW